MSRILSLLAVRTWPEWSHNNGDNTNTQTGCKQCCCFGLDLIFMVKVQRENNNDNPRSCPFLRAIKIMIMFNWPFGANCCLSCLKTTTTTTTTLAGFFSVCPVEQTTPNVSLKWLICVNIGEAEINLEQAKQRDTSTLVLLLFQLRNFHYPFLCVVVTGGRPTESHERQVAPMGPHLWASDIQTRAARHFLTWPQCSSEPARLSTCATQFRDLQGKPPFLWILNLRGRLSICMRAALRGQLF